jgi:rod shape-determining protein MreD
MSVAVRRPIVLAASFRARAYRERGLLFLLLLGAVLLQSGLSSALGVGWFRPDLVLILVVFRNAARSPAEGWLAALLGGLLSDIFSAGRLGLGPLSLAAGARVAVRLCRSLRAGHFGTKALMIAIASLVGAAVYYLLLCVYRIQPSVGWALKETVWPGLWQTLLVSPLVWWVCEKVFPE